MIPELREKLRGRRVVASVSGGKDSAALSLYLRELGIEHERIFSDTGWEHDLTYEYLRGPLQDTLGPITWLRNARQMEDLIRHKQMFPSRVRRFCTEHLKVRPIKAYLDGLEDDVVNAIGIRAAESLARAGLAEWEWSEALDCEIWRPLLRWTEQDVIAIHRRHGLRPNPLYLMGASRVGCWPCIFARKEELRLVADTDPARIERIRRLEQAVQEAAAARYAEAGETFESKGYLPPTFFVLSGDHTASKTDGAKRMFPIDEAVQWARTSRGGRQFQLFPPDGGAGCLKWGLCSTEPEPEVIATGAAPAAEADGGHGRTGDG